MANIQLPYQTPIYSALHYFACPGVAAKQNPTCDTWYYNCTVALNGHYDCYPHQEPSFMVYLEAGDITHIPFLERTSINTLFIKHCSIDLIRSMIQEGFYVYFGGIDDFYVEGKQGYQTTHRAHDGMVSGINDENKTLTLIAYDINQKFQPFTTSQHGFEKGLQEMLDHETIGELWAIKANQTRYTLDMQAIIDALQKYLNPPHCSLHKDLFSRTWHGIETYDGLISCFEMKKQREIELGHPAMMLFWEHKKCMLHRMIQIETTLHMDHPYSAAYQEIVSYLERLRYLYLKYTVSMQNGILESLQTKLKLLKIQEAEILSRFIQDPVVQKRTNQKTSPPNF